MISVEGQYIFIFSLADKGDFIDEDDLISFLLVEEAGNVLPTFDFGFTTKDETILRYLNEGNNLKISFGKDKDSLIDIELVISSFVFHRAGESKLVIEIKGLYSALPYISTGKIRTINSSGIAAINQVVSDYFIPDFNIIASSDSQNWIQHNIPDKKFVNEIWMHSYLANSFIGVGISSNGEFILKDMKALVAEDPSYRFTTNIEKDTDIYYDGDYVVTSNAGFLNHWIGYGRQKHLFTIEEGSELNSLQSSESLLALTGTLARSAAISKRIAQAGVLSDNVHANYWNAFLQNLQSLAIFSSCQITLSFHNIYIPLRILNLVMFLDTGIGQKQATEYYSGKYFVSKVARSISNRQFTTTVQLSRESLSDSRGELR